MRVQGRGFHGSLKGRHAGGKSVVPVIWIEIEADVFTRTVRNHPLVTAYIHMITERWCVEYYFRDLLQGKVFNLHHCFH